MNIFPFFNASSYNALSTSSPSNNDLFPSTVVAPTFPRQELPKVSAPVFVFPQVSQQRF
ncbi:hypothetical protein Nos7524_4664 [Nostoc sp. PCC 7524]|uniref:hypothetical protein n=1 Tax=Nostoc sp. (strain ATCC 29411 / PCC 7524) TaxID=28072 RepID=UPI00029EFE9D|nr:hypothetical protein [Nostoc sp. PCC 7524]AFY50409.1 hypothetical protein Nos7524_4664 [Nostoc sp. PCC 7524]